MHRIRTAEPGWAIPATPRLGRWRPAKGWEGNRCADEWRWRGTRAGRATESPTARVPVPVPRRASRRRHATANLRGARRRGCSYRPRSPAAAFVGKAADALPVRAVDARLQAVALER